ncbi:hypothetical protein GGR28_001924 [Lewinella aquimaris]|uniref:Outer membrane protein beta-barrel domain-containing protein n=1 Tax=Neolewinella aquimaris TaxID=1835722 RepID=A0A840E191_9BACT|nr:hypothetical protein [Neolewinella aquimaris]MBB4079304.1 hypothetical protein [Neolewinella aquimaris]
MIPLRYLTSLAFWLIFTAPAFAQIEVNPYIGLATGSQEVQLPGPTDIFETYTGDHLLAGVDLLFGAGQLAPLAGIAYRPNTYENQAGRAYSDHRLSLPLGAAYRILAADFDLNLVFHAAVVPGMFWGDDPAGDDRGVDWAARGGLTLYLGTVTVGGQYYWNLGEDPLEITRTNAFILTMGGRF